MPTERNWWQRLFFDHFWGKVECTFVISTIGLAINVGEKLGIKGWREALQSGFERWDNVVDILGGVSLIFFVPSVLLYILGKSSGKIR